MNARRILTDLWLAAVRWLHQAERDAAIEASMDALESWLRDGDPLDEAPEIEMGVWLSPEQADELDCLAAELWPANEYFAIADLYVRGES